ncbi:MAG: hypothetical protein ACKVT0_20490 [Planctomycetaceae bacterium]
MTQLPFWKNWLTAGTMGIAMAFPLPVVAQDADSTKSAAQATTQTETPAQQIDPLLIKVEKAIELSKLRYLSAETHTPWQIAHGILAFRHQYEIKQNGKLVKAIDWVSDNANYKGTPWFEKTQYGWREQPFSRPYIFQGHPNQFLGYFTLSRLPLDHQIRVGNDVFTIQDLIENSKMEVNTREEITWTLWALSHYLPADAEWKNQYGENWSIERLVQIQTDEPVANAACGGTHGLFVLSYARNKYLHTSGGKARGVWLEADQKIRRYVAEAKASQNSDGTFSTNFFGGSGYSQDFNKRLATTGHMVEWLMVALRPDEIRAPWIRSGVNALCDDLLESKDQPANVGPLYHAIDALQIYHTRTKPKEQVAKSDVPTEQKTETPNPNSNTPGGAAIPPTTTALPTTNDAAIK